MNKIREKIKSFFRGRYGIDELGKTIVTVSTVLYLSGVVFKSSFLLCFAMAGLFCGLCRAMSRRTWDRGRENYIYDRYKKLWKLQYKERKTSRIFMCKKCGSQHIGIRNQKKKSANMQTWLTQKMSAV